MAIWDQKAKCWKGRIRLSGYPQKTKTGFKTKSEALEWELKTKRKIKALKPGSTRLTFSLVSSEHIKYCLNHKYADSTIERKAQIIRDFITFLGCDPPFEKVNEEILEKYLDSMENKKTANRHLRNIKTVFNWAVKKKLCTENPCNYIERYRTRQFVRYVPPPEDINKVLSKANEFEFDFIQAIYHLAARRREVLTMKWEDIDFEKRIVAIWTRKRYEGTLERDVLKMNNILYDVLQKRLKLRINNSEYVFHDKNGNLLPRTKVEKILPRLCKKAGVKNFGFHAIRHHVSALMAASKKLSLTDIQQQLRHKSTTTTDYYLKSLVSESQAASVIEEMQTGRIKYENDQEK